MILNFIVLVQLISDSLVQSKPEKLLLNEIFELKPIAGHHFNIEAPQKCGSHGAIELSPRGLKCQATDAGSIKVTASVCDDKKSFCRQESFSIPVSAVKSKESPRFLAKLPEEAKVGDMDDHGFISNDLVKAQALAAKEGKLILIDFSGIWCPPCNLLDEHVFGEKEFKEATENFIKVKMDVDAASSIRWKDHFKIRLYPTLIVLNDHFNEIGRMIDYRPLVQIVRWVKEQEANKSEPMVAAINNLKVKNLQTDLRKIRVAKWYLLQENFKEASTALENCSTEECRKLSLKIDLARAEKTEDKQAQKSTLLELAQAFESDIEYANWILALFELDKTEAMKFVPKARKNLEQWQKQDYLSVGYGLADLYGTEGEILESSGAAELAKKYFSMAADEFQKMAKSSHLKTARGANLERIYYLQKAGRDQEVVDLGKKLAEAYKTEFTFNFRIARSLSALHREEEALPYARAAEQYGYGENWLRAVELVAKLELALNRPVEAKKHLDAALSELILPNSTFSGTQYTLPRLRDLAKEAEKKIAKN